MEGMFTTYIKNHNGNLGLIPYKVMTRVYYTRDRIHKFDRSSPSTWLKCGRKDSLSHSFWYCKMGTANLVYHWKAF